MATSGVTSAPPSRPLPVLARLQVRWLVPVTYFVRALARTAVMTLFVATVTFLVVRALPGNPVDIYIQDQVGAGMSVAAARAHASALLRVDLHQSLPVQYLQFMNNLLHGDLGASSVLAPGQSVTGMIMSRLPWTLFSVGAALIVGFVVGLRLGTFAAYRRGRWQDHLLTNLGAAGDSIPAVLLGIVLVFYLGVVWTVVPLDAMRGAYAADVHPGLNLPFMLSALEHVAVPGSVYVLTSLGGWLIAMRSNAISVLGEGYVANARARGLSDSRIRSAYVQRNARLPLVTGFAISLGFVVSGAVLIEDIFVYPGVGQLLATALARRDYTVMQGIVIVTTLAVLATTAVADALYGWLDPRVRVAQGAT